MNLKLLVLLFTFTFANFGFAQYEASIPLTDRRMPSDDLYSQNKILTAGEAHTLKSSGVDLSKINPAPSVLWGIERQDLELDNDLPINSFDHGDFKATLLSTTGLFRFNVNTNGNTAIIHLNKKLHTILLRKNILRLMGYRIPQMKWLSEFTIHFSHIDQMKDFLDSQIPRATLGAATRWIKEKNENSLYVTLKDVAVSIPRSSDHYNLSLGVPPKTLTNRTLRALIVPYALLDLGESVNSFSWNVGRIDNDSIVLPHFTRGLFATTINDAKWAMRKVSELTREDFQNAVNNAHFPKPVAKILVEKLISRQNSLAELIQIQHEKRDYELEISSLPELNEGKLLKQDWEDYGSNFAHGAPDSPFKDFHWYALAKIQALGIDNLINRANQKLSLFNPNQARADFHKKQFKKGLDHFVKTGEFLAFPVGSWISPIADVNLIASRDVVVGNYLGTDNLVQLADTIGWSVEVGPKVGFENLEIAPTVAVQATQRLIKTWTHLKPLTSLKNAFKEPYKNVIVPILKLQFAKELDKLQDLKNSDNPNVDWNLQEEDTPLANIIAHLNNKLGVGESIIMSEKMNPSVVGSLGTTLMGTPVHLSLSGGVDYVQIRRIQIYRKSATIYQVYDDIGNGSGWSLNVSVKRFIPIMRLSLRGQKGEYSVRLHDIDLNPELSENPQLFDKAHALSSFLQTGSAELLESISPPHIIDAKYGDRSNRFAFLFWRRNKLKADTNYEITSSNGLRGNYVTYSDERQTGMNPEAFAKDLINYGLQRISFNARWAPPVWQNPAQTIGGIGNTKSIRYEARVNQENMSHEKSFIQFSEKYEGWSKKVKSLKKKLMNLNNKYGYTLFDDRALNNLDGLKLFNISVNVNLYERAIERLKNINTDLLIKYEDDYEVEKKFHLNGCQGNSISERTMSDGREVQTCGSYSSIIRKNLTCKEETEVKKSTKCYMKLFTLMYDKLNITQIKNLLGEENIYIYGSINGFRKNDEVLNEPILSNSSGKIGSRFGNGPFERIIQLLGIQSGEMHGHWLRDRL